MNFKMLMLWTSLLGCPMSHGQTATQTIKNYIIYYDDQLPATEFFGYDLVVFDALKHPPLKPLKEKNIPLLGYLNAGEINQHRFYFEQMHALGILGEENPNWPGSFYVDVRDPRWLKFIIEERIPAILQKGFDGIFIDTLDNPPHLEREWPDQYKGSTQAAAHLIQAIRLHFPQIKIMLNRAYEILPDVASLIDYHLAEALFSSYDFETESYLTQNEEFTQQHLQLLEQVQARHPHLQRFALDYANVSDLERIKSFYRQQKEHQFVPLVSTIQLDCRVEEP